MTSRKMMRTALLLTAVCIGVRAWAESNLSDSGGFLWDLQEDGAVSDGGNDTYDEGIVLVVNRERFEGGPQAAANGGREVVIGPSNVDGLLVTRMILVPEKEACARYLEVIENTGDADKEVTLSFVSSLGSGSGSSTLPESGPNGVSWSVVAQDGSRSVMGHRYASDRAKVQAQVRIEDGTVVERMGPIKVAAGRRVAVLHVVAQRRGREDAEAFVRKLDLAGYLRGIKPELRRILINVSGSGALYALGDLELFRGTQTDAIRLHSGECLFGELQTPTLQFASEFGSLTVKTSKVLSFFAGGEGDIRLVLDSGEVLTGKAAEKALSIRMRGGRSLDVPLERIASFGRRLPPAVLPKADAEVKEGEGGAETANLEAPGERIPFTEPVFLLRGGDRLIATPSAPRLAFHTLYGEVSVEVAAFLRMSFPSEDVRVPVIELADGSSFAAIPAESQWKVRRNGGPDVSLDTGRLAAVFFVPEEPQAADEEKERSDAPPDGAPVVRLANGDRFRAALQGSDGVMTLETPFGEQRVEVAQVRRLSHRPGVARGLSVTLWDGSALPGRSKESRLAFKPSFGGTLSVPLEALAAYDAPHAATPPEQAAKFEALVVKLGDADGDLRAAAQAELAREGLGVLGILARHWEHKDLEVRNRVRATYAHILKHAEEEGAE